MNQDPKFQATAEFIAKSARLESDLIKATTKAGAALGALKDARAERPQDTTKVYEAAQNFRALDAEASGAYQKLLEHLSTPIEEG